MQPKKIALFLPSLEGGGAERVFVQLAGQFAARGYPVELVLASRTGPYLVELSPEINVVDLGASGVVRSLPKFIRYLRASRPEVVLSGLDHANIIAIVARFLSRTGTRNAVSMRSVPTAVYRYDKSRARWVMLQLIRMTFPLADTIIANSRAVQRDLAETLRIRNRNISVVYNPLDIERIDRLSRADVDHPWAGRDAPPVAVSVGSIAVLKDFPTLVRAFSIVRKTRDCRLVILGEGPGRDQLEALIGELGVQRDVFLPGFVDNPFAWIRRAAVFVSSSLTEGCPNALMQALACNTPIVSTDCVGGSAEILQDGKWGRLVATRDAEAMAEAILQTLDSEHHIELVPRANDFALDKIVNQYLDVLVPDDAAHGRDDQR